MKNMKSLKILIVSLFVITFLASCSEDNNIEINQIEEKLEGEAGESLEIFLRLMAEDGIAQIVAESEELGLDYFENIETAPGGMNVEFTVTIPSDAKADDEYEIDVQVSDTSGDRSEEVLTITVK